MLKVETKKALKLNAIRGFRGIAYDGLWFYLTVENENKIMKFDVSFYQIECFETCRCYTYLCYDSIEDCFWATDCEDSSCIYKLNNIFEQIDNLSISIPGVRGRRVNGISHNYESDKLFISFSDAIVIMDKHSFNDCSIFYSSYNKRIRGATDLFSSYICYGILRPRQEIRICSLNGRLINRIFIPSCFHIVSMVSLPNGRNCSEHHLYILLTHRNGGQFAMKCIVKDYNIYKHEKCCYETLEWISLKENRLAHCLNVESDKLITTIHSSNNVTEINNAITLLCKLIDKVAREERELTDKLQKVMEHCDFCNETCLYRDND